MNEGNASVRELERRDFLKKWASRLACVAVLIAMSGAGLYAYRHWRKQHLAKQTADFVTQGDYKNAVLVARRLLELDPNNLPAAKAMAEMAEKSGQADAVAWYRKVVQLEPTRQTNQFALARVALRFGQVDLAEHILNNLPENERQSVDYHQLAGTHALAKKDVSRAEAHFSTALQSTPGDAQLALNLALIRLATSNAEAGTKARADLVRLVEQSPVRIAALRALATDALAQHDTASAARWATQLKAEPTATLADALLFFQAMQGTEEAAGALAEVQTKAAASPRTASELITWLNRHQLAQVAAHWAALLPDNIRETPPVPLAMAESLSFLQDWKGLHEFVAEKNWGEFEALRLAVETHATHRLHSADRPSMQAEATWRSALKLAQKRPAQLLALAQLAEGWGYRAEAEEGWWMIANSNDNTKLALSALQQLYKRTQDTRGLQRVARRALALNPDDLVAANNYASFGLLLNGDSSARRLAAKLHTDHPKNRAFTTTYAYALHTEGRTADGLQLLETLNDDELRHPAIAAYYVILLVESGDLERARGYIETAKRAPLLPEEQQLLSAALRKLGASDIELAKR